MSNPDSSHFTRPELGSFGEYLLAKAAVQIKIPPNLSFEQAASLGVSIVTVVSSPCFISILTIEEHHH